MDGTEQTAGQPDGMVVLMSSAWSKEQYELSEAEILEKGVKAIKDAGIPVDPAHEVVLKKWRYANMAKPVIGRRYSASTVSIPTPSGQKIGLPLFLASDAFSSDIRGVAEVDPQLGVQRAVMSGVEVGRVLAGLMGVPR